MKKNILILGGGGFIGGNLAKKLKEDGDFIRIADIKNHEYHNHADICNEFFQGDLRNYDFVKKVMSLDSGSFDEVYQLAADMGGALYIFTGNHDADVMHNSATINLNVLDALKQHNDQMKSNKTKVFYSSSACIYPEHNQLDPSNPNCEESSAYPANPDSEYGWEKLFSERLYMSFNRNYGIPVHIARFHNIYGPLGTWQGGKEKAPAAICRKVLTSNNEIEIWGDGNQTRSFLYIDDCIDAVRLLMESDFMGPVNIGSEEMVSINQLVDIACEIDNKTHLVKNHIPGPTGVRGRNSDNRLIEKMLGWKPQHTLQEGLQKTYFWIKSQLER